MAREIPIVSVIISTYNRPRLLKKAIQSVINQSFQEWELLVVDDCSPQATDNRITIKDFHDERIKYIATDRNYGHDGHPKNVGVKQAFGQYICFLDDDDTYRPDALKILLTYAKETEAHVVYGDYLIGKKPGWSLDFSPSLLGRMNYISMGVVLCRKDALLEVGGFDEDVPKFKDWNLWIRLQKAGKVFIHVPILVADVTIEEDSISNKYKVKYDLQGNYLPIIVKDDGTEQELFNPVDCKIYPKTTCLGEKKPLKVAIYTMTMNRIEYTQQMFGGLCKTSNYPSEYDFDWFVVDQGSTDGTVEWLKNLINLREHFSAQKNIIAEFNEKNVGLAQGWNQCFELIKKTGAYDIVIKVDNDAQMMTEGWLKAMIDIFECNKNFILSPYVEGLEKSPGGVMRRNATGSSPYTVMSQYVLGAVPNLGGIVFAHSIDLVKDWKFPTTYEGNKDFLLSKYARSKGYNLFYMEEFRVWHIDGTAGQHQKFPDYFSAPTNDSVK